jgi:glucuronoarabinoxylan endo-1,4-beta-xylanase
MLPEDQNWETNLYFTTMSDPNAAADVGIIACHDYVEDNLIGDQNPPAALPLYDNTNAALWETEVATLGDSFDPSITNAMYWATRVHLFMTVAQANAWHYWYLITGESDNEGLEGSGNVPTKRMFAVGQFSRFVRPNYYRIGVANPNPNLMISAYKTNSGSFAIVAINTNTTSIAETFNLTNFNAASVTPWMTTSNLSLTNQTSVAVSGGSFTYTLPAMSVVTFVGQGYAVSTNITISGVSYAPNGTSLVLTWNSTASVTYSVLKTNVLGGSAINWPAIVTNYPAGGALGGSLSYTDTTVTVSPAFYQVRSP